MLNASVVSSEPVGDETAIIRIRPDGAMPRYRAGQHMGIGLMEDGVLVERHYSLASAPGDPYIELYTRGALSGRVRLPEHGSGILTLDDVPHGRDLLMIATGTGIAPFISMFRTFKSQTHWRSFTLVHGVRRVQDLGYRALLEASPIRYVPVVSREPFSGATGRVQSVLPLDQLDREQTHAFVCGSSEMVGNVEQLLRGAGLSHVHTEKYA